MRITTEGVFRGVCVLALAPVIANCALKNDVQEALSGCDEFAAGSEQVAKLDVDVKVKAFAQASSELREVGDSIEADVKGACVAIAKDLGETDVWSSDDGDSSIANAQKTGACDVVAAKVDAIMTAGEQAGANFALAITGGECSVDADLQAKCEATCKTEATCTEPTVETRCTPAELSGQCEAECKAEALPKGAPTPWLTVWANASRSAKGLVQASCAGPSKGDATECA